MLRRKLMILVLIVLTVTISLLGQEKPTTSTTLPAAAPKEETKALDEVTLLRLQNGILRIQSAQKDAALAQQAIEAAQTQLQKDYDKFLEANKLDLKEWQLDPQRMVLVKKKQ